MGKSLSINTHGGIEMLVPRRYDRARCSGNFNHIKVIIRGLSVQTDTNV